MDLDSTLLAALGAGLAAGAIVVHLLHRRADSADRERADQLSSELEETREELESHREEVARHFGQTSDLFRDLTEQYTRLYAHLADGARSFSDDGRAILEQVEPPRLEGQGAPSQPEQPAGDEPEAEEPQQAEDSSAPGPERANGGRHPDAPSSA